MTFEAYSIECSVCGAAMVPDDYADGKPIKVDGKYYCPSDDPDNPFTD